MVNVVSGLLAVGVFVCALPTPGHTAQSEGAGVAGPKERVKALYHKGRWEFSLESAYLFEVVTNPLTRIGGDYTRNKLPYRLATQILSARYLLTDPAGPLFLRGSLEVSGNLIGSSVIEGPEPYVLGLAVGLRYYVVQPEAKIVPYLDVRGGPALTDARARGREYAQQEDLTFTYMFGAGVRYDLNPRFSFSLGVADQHMSNLYLTRPNYGFDVIGVNLGLFVRF